jgi:hypothetical protein
LEDATNIYEAAVLTMTKNEFELTEILEFIEWAEELDCKYETDKYSKHLQKRLGSKGSSFAKKLAANLKRSNPNSILSLNIIEGLGGAWLSNNEALFNMICRLGEKEKGIFGDERYLFLIFLSVYFCSPTHIS